jgi:hypothetical protein
MDPAVNVISSNGVPDVEALRSGRPGLAQTPVTYGLLRRLLEGSGIIEEREAQKMDRAFHRILHS